MSFHKKKPRFFRILCVLLAFLMVQNSLEHIQAQDTPFLPTTRHYFLDLSSSYSLPVLRGMRVYPAKPFEFDFMVGSGDRHTIDQKETSLLIKYFLTCLTIPAEDLWVNLSPYESGRIIPDELALTDAGNNLLVQDKLLKQLASSLTYPESRLGKKFWEQVYKKTYEKFGTSNLPVNTYNKVWIVPERAVVYDMGDRALIGDTHLKVMLDEDYLATQKHQRQLNVKAAQGENITQSITKEIILPELEKEINEGKNFAPVRQIFHSMVLAAWFKRALKRNVLSDFYVNKKKISGVDDVDKKAKEDIYKQYLRIYKVGAYNYIREDVDLISQQVVPRKYFSGGLFFGDLDRAMRTLQVPDFAALQPLLDRAQNTDVTDAVAKVVLRPVGGKQALVRLTRGILAAFAFGVTISMAGGLQAAQIKPDVDGKTLHVTVDKKDYKGLGKILLQDAGYPTPLWGPKGTVAEVEKIVKDKIPNIERIYVGQSFDIPTKEEFKKALPEQGQLRPESKKESAIVTQATAPQSAPSASAGSPPPLKEKSSAPLPTPSIVRVAPAPPSAASPVAAAPTDVPVPRAAATSQAAAPAGPVVVDIPPETTFNQVDLTLVPRIFGQVYGFIQGKTDFNEGEIIYKIRNFENEAGIESLENRLKNKENLLIKSESLLAAGNRTVQAAAGLRKEVQELRQQIADRRAQQALGEVRAPHKLRITNFNGINNGVFVTQENKHEMKYYAQGYKFSFDFLVPREVTYLGHIVFDGIKIHSYSVSVFRPDADPAKNFVSLTVILPASSQIHAGEKVKLSLKIYPPDDKDSIKHTAQKDDPMILTDVFKLRENSIPAPAAGNVTYFKKPGNFMKTGEVLAQINPRFYQEQLNGVQQEIQELDRQIKVFAPGPGGEKNAGDDFLVDLLNQKADFMALEHKLQQQINSMTIRAPYAGVITWTGEDESKGIQNGGELVRYVPDIVDVGSNDNVDPKYRILVSDKENVRTGSPVGFETLQGIRLKGQVMDVRPAYSSNIRLQGQQSLIIAVQDPQHALGPDMTGRLILLTDSEQKALRVQTAFAGPSPPPKLRRQATNVMAVSVVSPAIELTAPGQNPFNNITLQVHANDFPPGSSLDPQQTLDDIFANRLVGGQQEIRMLQALASEELPGAFSLNLFGRADNNGKFAGGLEGGYGGFSGAITSGSALGGPIPMVFQFVGNIIDLLDGKVGKQKAKNVTTTKMEYYKWLTEVRQQGYVGQKLLYQLGADQQLIAFKKGLVEDLHKAIDQMKSSMENTTFDIQGLELQINDINTEITDLQGQAQNLTRTLNALRGKGVDHLSDPILVDLSRIGTIQPISLDRHRQMRERTLADTSVNTGLRADLTTRREMTQQAAIEGLDYLPKLNVTGIYGSRDLSNAEYNLVPGTTEASSQIHRVFGLLTGETPLFDGKLKIRTKITALGIEGNDIKIADTRLQLALGLDNTVSDLNRLAGEIHDKEVKLKNAIDYYNTGLRTRLPRDLVEARKQIFNAQQELVQKRALYWEGQAFLGFLEPRQFPLRNMRNMVERQDRAQLAMPSFFQKVALAVVIAVASFTAVPPAVFAQNSNAPQYSQSSFGRLSPAYKWRMLHAQGQDQNLFESTKNIASNGSDVSTRLDAVRDLSDFYQKDSGSSTGSMENAALESTHPDVVGEIFSHFEERKEALSNILRMIIKAPQAKSGELFLNRGYQSLDYVLRDPDKLKLMEPGIHYPGVSPRALEELFLRFLSRDSVDSVTKLRFLQHYWRSPGSEQVEILKTFVTDNPDDPGVKKLVREIHDLTLRQNVWDNMDTSFALGNYDLIPFLYPDSDFISRVVYQKFEEETRFFLNTAPSEKEMDQYLKRDLSLRGHSAANDPVPDYQEPSNSTQSSAVNDLSYQPVRNNLFEQWNEARQKEYIDNTKNIPALASLLNTPSFFRNEIADRLTSTLDGRVLLLEAYLAALKNQDAELPSLIEHRYDWVEILKKDIETIHKQASQNKDVPTQDAVTVRVIREALEKMAGRTGQQLLLDLRLLTFPAQQLHSVQDLRGESPETKETPLTARINVLATGWAVQVIEEEGKSQPVPWRSYAIHTEQEKRLLRHIKDQIVENVNPQDFEVYFNGLVQRNEPETKKMMENLVSIRKNIAERIWNNEQEIPMVMQGQWEIIKGIIGAIVLGLLFVFRGSHFKRWYSIPQLLRILRKELGVKNGNGVNHNGRNAISILYDNLLKDLGIRSESGPIDIVTVSRNTLSFKPLDRWQKLVNQWKQDTSQHMPVEDLLNDLHSIRIHAEEVERVTPYKEDLMKTQDTFLNNEYTKSYVNYYELAGQTIYILTEHLKNRKLTPIQRQRFKQDTGVMLESMGRASEFLDILCWRGNLDKYNSYKYKKSHFVEWTGLYPYSRLILLYHWVKTSAYKNLIEKHKIRQLLKRTNKSRPGFYENPDGIVAESTKRLDDVVEHNTTFTETSTPGGNLQHKFGSMVGRIAVSIGLTLSIVTWLAGHILGLPSEWIFIGQTASILSVLVYASYVIRNLISLNPPWKYTMKVVIKKLEDRLKNLPQESDEPQLSLDVHSKEDQNGNRALEKFEVSQNKIIAVTEKVGLEGLKTELANPKVDMFVFVGGQKNPDTIKNLQTHMDSLRGSLIRENVPVEYYPGFDGSAEAYEEILMDLENKFNDRDYREKHPGLKSWENAGVVIIYQGRKSVPNNFTLIDWNILNSYPAAAIMAKEYGPRQWHIMLQAGLFRAGAIQLAPGSDMTILTSKANIEQARFLALVNSSIAEDGNSDIISIRENESFDDNGTDKLGSKFMQFLKRKGYNLENHSHKQFAVMNGVVLLGPKAVAMNLKIAKRLKAKELMGIYPLHLVSDLWIPELKARTGNFADWLKDIMVYAVERSERDDIPKDLKEGRKTTIQRINTEIREEVSPDVKIKEYASAGDVYEPFITTIEQIRMIESKLGGLMKVVASNKTDTGVSPGGIDLNFQPQFIQRSSGLSPAGISQGAFANLPDGFKGFNFNIVRFTPNLTVYGAFQLMFNPN
jgi:Outer membrane efflux protein